MHNAWVWSTICGLHYQATYAKNNRTLNRWPYDYKHIKEVNHEYKKIRFQILAQAPTNKTNTELWLKRQEYLWVCRLGTLNKLSKKGLNKLIYDPTYHSNPDHK